MASKREGDAVDALAKARANVQQQREQWQATADSEWSSIAARDRLSTLWDDIYPFPGDNTEWPIHVQSAIVKFCDALEHDEKSIGKAVINRFKEFDETCITKAETDALSLIRLCLTDGQAALAEEIAKRSKCESDCRDWLRVFDSTDLFYLLFNQGEAERRDRLEKARDDAAAKVSDLERAVAKLQNDSPENKHPDDLPPAPRLPVGPPDRKG
jgi:hypothetical protein